MVALALVLALAVAGPVAGQEPSGELPALLSADRVDHDRERDLVIASGHVEISQGNRTLLADRVTLDRKTDTVTASGNVSLLEPTGEVIFADYVELTDNMGSGLIRNLRVLFPDESRLAAAGAKRVAGVEKDMRKAVFSPCKLCEDKPKRPPLWQIKAVKVIHDEKARNIEYYDAFLEMFGYPVAYTPYLSHPDPTVERRSGLLTPRIGTSTDLGFIFGLPYYVDIAPDKDTTIEPIITSDQGPVLFAEYRQHLANGRFAFSGSITRGDRLDSVGGVEEDKVRGHVRGNGRFDLDDTWRTGFDVARALDDTYLRRYNFGSEDVLTTRLFVEGFHRRNYAAVNGYAFQGLRARDVDELTPLVLPLIDYNFVGTPTRRGTYWTLDANFMSLTREDGADSHRLSFKGGWHMPHTGPSGHVFDLSLRTQADVYFVNDVPDQGAPSVVSDGVTGRFFPQLVFNWRYPLVREVGRTRQLVEPVAAIVVGPNGGNPGDIPNEDSQAFEWDDTDLFSPNRFTGLDRVEGGQRLDYGLIAGVYGPRGGSTTGFLGQSFRFRDDSLFPAGSGLEDQLSDLVGRVHVRPGTNLDLLYRFRLGTDQLRARRNELTVNVGPPLLNLSLDYIFIDRRIGTGGFDDREEIMVSARSRLSDYWSVNAHGRRDLTDDGGMLSTGFGVVYEDECFQATGTFLRTFTRDRDIEPADTFMFHFIFKHLGEFQL